MQAIILAAGHGTRLWPMSEARPKVMMPIGNRPILEHIIESLTDNGVKDIAIVVGYRRGVIQAYFGDGSEFNASITYIEQSKLLGTAHALVTAKDFPKGDFIVLPGDNVISPQVIKDLLAGGANSALLTRSDIPSKYGVVELVGEEVESIVEKPRIAESCVISTGIFLLERGTLPLIEREVDRGRTGLAEVMNVILREVRLKGMMTKGCWCDAVYPWDVIDMTSRFMRINGQLMEGRVEPGVNIKGPVCIGEGTRIRSGCTIEGPVIIGKGCDIGPNVTIFPTTSIGDNVTVAPFSYLTGAVVMSGSTIGSHCHISRSLIDCNVHLGPHFCSPSGNTYGRAKDELIPLHDLGCVIGSNTTVGSCVSLQPGVIVGNGCRLRDGVRVRENIADRSEVY